LKKKIEMNTKVPVEKKSRSERKYERITGIAKNLVLGTPIKGLEISQKMGELSWLVDSGS